ncbi:unnamed protein product [Dovyalis caffra]|uniref:Uncharacterized protein n=1 Tax=Dovyalis caffra TaxID=77055 RepID=A0AAV1SRB0_9ROSI|nr:unnamed protein product [Dovyalis caffra]
MLSIFIRVVDENDGAKSKDDKTSLVGIKIIQTSIHEVYMYEHDVATQTHDKIVDHEDEKQNVIDRTTLSKSTNLITNFLTISQHNDTFVCLKDSSIDFKRKDVITIEAWKDDNLYE